MSNLVRVVEPRTNIKDVNQHVVLLGGQTYNYEVVNAQGSATSSQSLRFDFSPASTNTVVDRRILLRCYVEFLFNGLPEIGVNDAPRCLPLASCMSTLSVSINGTQLSSSPDEYVHAFMRYYGDAKSRDKDLSTTPSMLDSYQTYSDWASIGLVSGGSARNPLAGFGEVKEEQSRGGFKLESLVQEGENYKARYIFTEPLLLSPFHFYGQNDMGFTNINKLIVNIKWDNLSRMWSHSSLNPALSTVQTSFYQGAELLINSITPNALTPALPEVNYAYLEPQAYPLNIGIVNAGASRVGVSSNSVKMSMVPHSVLLFCRRSRDTSTFLTSDTFSRIDRVRVFWNNRDVMGGASPQQLYHIAKKNGYNGNYAEFSNYTGSVLQLNLASDVGLPDTEAPGTVTQATLRVEIDITNTSSENIEYQYYMVPIMQGVVSISENGMINTLGNLSKSEVVEASSDAVHEVDHNMLMLEGSGLFSDIKHFLNKGSRFVENVSRIAQRVPILREIAEPVGDIASGVRRLTGGAVSGGGFSGGGISGGSAVTRGQLRHRRR